METVRIAVCFLGLEKEAEKDLCLLHKKPLLPT